MASMCFDRYKTPKSSSNKDWSAPFLIQLVMMLIFTINRETYNSTLLNFHLLVIKIREGCPHSHSNYSLRQVLNKKGLMSP